MREVPKMSSTPSLPRTIVAAVDGSAESLVAAHYAIEMAKVTGANVVALNVILLPEYIPEDVQKRLKEELMARGQASMEQIVKDAENAGVNLQNAVIDTTASVVNTICDYAVKANAGMIIVGTRGTGRIAKVMLGSVAAGIARTANCPVLVVR
jgi:nucleotide-binding universal stress UspA family protein